MLTLQHLSGKRDRVKFSLNLQPNSEVNIGRAKSSDLRLVLGTVSKQHLTLHVQADQVQVQVKGSNGVTVEETHYTAGQQFTLRPSQSFTVCSRIFRLIAEDSSFTQGTHSPSSDEVPKQAAAAPTQDDAPFASPKSATSRRISDMLLYRTAPTADIDSDTDSSSDEDETSPFTTPVPANGAGPAAPSSLGLETLLQNLRFVNDSPSKMAQYSLRERLLIRSAVKASRQRQALFNDSPISGQRDASDRTIRTFSLSSPSEERCTSVEEITYSASPDSEDCPEVADADCAIPLGEPDTHASDGAHTPSDTEYPAPGHNDDGVEPEIQMNASRKNDDDNEQMPQPGAALVAAAPLGTDQCINELEAASQLAPAVQVQPSEAAQAQTSVKSQEDESIGEQTCQDQENVAPPTKAKRVTRSQKQKKSDDGRQSQPPLETRRTLRPRAR